MPLLEYRCDCGRYTEEVFGVFSDAPETMDLGGTANPLNGSCNSCFTPIRKRFPLPSVRVDYSDMKYFGTKQWADNERSKVGIGSG